MKKLNEEQEIELLAKIARRLPDWDMKFKNALVYEKKLVDNSPIKLRHAIIDSVNELLSEEEP